ncbi:MAG TPA: 50S ribosomal protein L29 [Actinomycetota bacterium]|nr:50S ribosomal protein L29 [Actinomycetota bacterium]
MAKLKGQEIRDLSHEEMVKKLEETKEELFNLRFQNATGQLDNYKRLRELKRDIARIKTVMRQQEIAAAEAPE